MKEKTGSYRFRTDDSASGDVAGQGNVILLRSFRNLSAHEFSFPFQGMSKARDALKIQYKPLLGEGTHHVEFIPFFTKVSKKSSSGCVFLRNKEEATPPDETASAFGRGRTIWPVPLAFAGEVGPNGLLIWTDEKLITSVWIKDWTPVFYKTTPSEATSPEDEERGALEYIEGIGGNAEKILIVDAKDVTDEDMERCGLKTIAACPSYANLDLSGAGTNMREHRERLLSALAATSRAALCSGILFLIAASVMFARQSSIESRVASNSIELYETAFEERSMQPLVSAAAKLRSSGEIVRDDSITSFLRDISSVWEKLGDESGITIETLRYGSENADIQGTADGNEPIQRLRSRLEELGYSLRVDNIQSIPGGGMRFSMNTSKGRSVE
ncbi:MAG: hypothetical protein LBT23_07515 [Synergistaceae bacterium]|jgi:hypothetical protein|nr:hypothetical protein [Synergistaceae bacterium]